MSYSKQKIRNPLCLKHKTCKKPCRPPYECITLEFSRKPHLEDLDELDRILKLKPESIIINKGGINKCLSFLSSGTEA